MPGKLIKREDDIDVGKHPDQPTENAGNQEGEVREAMTRNLRLVLDHYPQIAGVFEELKEFVLPENHLRILCFLRGEHNLKPFPWVVGLQDGYVLFGNGKRVNLSRIKKALALERQRHGMLHLRPFTDLFKEIYKQS